MYMERGSVWNLIKMKRQGLLMCPFNMMTLWKPIQNVKMTGKNLRLGFLTYRLLEFQNILSLTGMIKMTLKNCLEICLSSLRNPILVLRIFLKRMEFIWSILILTLIWKFFWKGLWLLYQIYPNLVLYGREWWNYTWCWYCSIW